MKKSNEKGITLVALVITIIILIVLASIGTYAAKDTIESARLTKFTTELKIMQYKVNELYSDWKENKTITIDGETYGNSNNKEGIKDIDKNLGQSVDKCPKPEQIDKALAGKSKDDYCYFSNDLIKKLEVEGVEQDFFIDIETRSVVSCDGVKYKNNWYYTIDELPDSLYNVEYNPTDWKEPEFNVSVTEIPGENKKWQVSITDIKYEGYIKKWKVRYKEENSTNWYVSDNLTFTIYEKGDYEIVIYNGTTDSSSNPDGSESSSPYVESEPRYQIIADEEYDLADVIVYYDATKNSGDGHDGNANVWKDLSENNFDMELKGLDFTNASGWTEDSLILDGKDDYGVIQELDLSNQKYNDITICATFKILSTNNKSALIGMATTDYGRIFTGYDNVGYCSNFTDSPPYKDIWISTGRGYDTNVNNLIYTFAGRNSNSKNTIYKNNEKLTENSSFMNSNYRSNSLELARSWGGADKSYSLANIQIYDLVIYNRTLTPEQIKDHYNTSRLKHESLNNH